MWTEGPGRTRVGVGRVRPTPGRLAALEALGRVRLRSAYARQTLHSVLRETTLDSRESALATRLLYGTVLALGHLDEAIDARIHRPGRLEPRVRDALRVAAYELLYLSTPRPAAVHQGVEMVRTVRPQAVGLANAVLRRLAEDTDTFPWGDPGTDLDALARLYGHPRWVVDLLVADIGEADARRMLEADTQPPPLYLWHNPFLGTLDAAMRSLETDGVAVEPCGAPWCLRAGLPARAVKARALHEGRVLVCDRAAQVAALASAPLRGVVVDLAAGRGTKTAQLQAVAAACGRETDLIALDVHPHKVGVLRERLTHLAVPSFRAEVCDVTDPSALAAVLPPASADLVLVDAPCSGLGTLRRHPDKLWRSTVEDIGRLATLQSRMLEAAASLVAPGGAIVYATCTVTRRENEDVVMGFLAGPSGRGFHISSLSDRLSRYWEGEVRPEGWFQSIPRADGPDGHFVARLERDED